MKLSLAEILVALAMVIFGAIVHATAQLKLARDKSQPFTVTDFAILVPIAIFSGTMFGLLSTFFFSEITPIILFSSLGAFLGIAGLNRLANAGLEFLTYKLNNRNKQNEND